MGRGGLSSIEREGFRARAALLALAAILAVLFLLRPTASAAQASAAAAGAAATASRADQVETVAEALSQDAAYYARRYGVGQDEAVRRLRAQQDSVATIDRLAAIFADRLAGVAIEHRPAFRITFLLTGTEAVPDTLIYAGGMNVPIHFVTGAAATRRAIVSAIEQHQGEIRAALPFAVGMGADARSGALAVTVRAADADRYGRDALQRQVAAIAGVPARIVTLEQSESNAALYGGSRVTGVFDATGQRGACTAGFVVTDGARTGIITAAHCPAQLNYRDVDGAELALSLVGKWGSGHQDVQVSTADQALMPLFRPDPRGADVRPLTAVRGRAETRTGEFVCHGGIRSGYSCAEVQFVDYAPHPDVCGALCDPDWVTVAGPDCGKGDSGGPVFSGTIAFGITKGISSTHDRCGFYFYMSTDYLPPSWSLLRRPTPQESALASAPEAQPRASPTEAP